MHRPIGQPHWEIATRVNRLLPPVVEVTLRGNHEMGVFRTTEHGIWRTSREVSGEVVKLFVVRNSDSLTEKDVIAHCRNHLTGYKVPKQVVFKDDLPKTNVGKILRRELRD